MQSKNYARFQLGSLKPLTAEKTEVSLYYPRPLNPSHCQFVFASFFREYNNAMVSSSPVLLATSHKDHRITSLHPSIPLNLDKYSPSFCCSDHCSLKMGFDLGWARQSYMHAYCCGNISSSVTSTSFSPPQS